MSSLNDVVTNWGKDNVDLDESYDSSKYRLVDGFVQDTVYGFDGADSYNEGLMALAASLVLSFGLALETGDVLLTQSGDRLILE